MITKYASLFVLSFIWLMSYNDLAFARKQSSLVSSKVLHHSFYPETFLTSYYSSWAINPKSQSSNINLIGSWRKFEKKKNTIVAVIDSGVQFNHPFLMPNLYVPKSKVGPDNYGIDFTKNSISTSPSDSHGHGTHISGIIKSIFPEVKILALKYYNPHATDYENLNSSLKALKYAIDHNVDVINYSSGGSFSNSKELELLKLAEQKGILVIAAAGNEHANIDISENSYFPASYKLSNIISVGAHDEFNKLIATSNWGATSVDVAAPGFRIRSSLPGSSVGEMSGTSQATAFVTGVVAMIKSQFPKISHQQIKKIIINSSKKIPSFKNKILSGGKLDASNAMDLAIEFNKNLFTGSREVATAI